MPYKDPNKQRQYQCNWAKGRKGIISLKSAKREYEQGIRRWLLGIKVERGCADCRTHHPAVLEFHHIDPAKKVFSIGTHGGGRNLGREVIAQEIAKCEVLCANCHRIRHWSERMLAKAG